MVTRESDHTHEDYKEAARGVITLLKEKDLLDDPRAKALIKCFDDERKILAQREHTEHD